MAEDADETEGSLLTERQVRVLELRGRGLSQQEIAEILGTTRSNVSILEKRAHQNIKRAEKTLRQWMAITAPISLKVPAGTDVFNIPSMVFEVADKMGIRLPVTSTDIVFQLKAQAPHLFRKRAVPEDMEVRITKDGEVVLTGLHGAPGEWTSGSD